MVKIEGTQKKLVAGTPLHFGFSLINLIILPSFSLHI
jgi:hypothetical protein